MATPDTTTTNRTGDFVFLSISMIRSRGQCFGKELVQGAPCVQAHHLHAQADTQDGPVLSFIQCPKESSLEGLSPRINWCSPWMGRNPEVLHDRIIPSGEYKSITSINQGPGIHWITGQDYGQPPRLSNGIQVRGSNGNTAIDDIRGKTNEGYVDCHVSYIGSRTMFFPSFSM